MTGINGDEETNLEGKALLHNVDFSYEENSYFTSNSKTKWIYPVTISVLNFSNGWAWMYYSDIEGLFARNFDTSKNYENLLTQVFYLSLAIFIFPAILLVEKGGLRASVFTVAVFQFLGSILKIIGSFIFVLDIMDAKHLILASQILFAMVSPVILLLPTKLSSTCFEANERVFANSIASVGNILGATAVKLIIPVNYVTLKNMIFTEIISAVPVAVGFFMAFTFTRRHFAKIIRSSDDSILDSFKKLLINKKFLFISATFGIVVAVFNILLTKYNKIISSQHFTMTENGIAFNCIICISVLVSCTITYFIGKYIDGEKLARISLLVLAVTLNVYYLMDILLFHYVFSVILGILVISNAMILIPYLLTIGVKFTFPVPDSISSGFQWLVSSFFTLIITIFFQQQAYLQYRIDGVTLPLTAMMIPLISISVLFIYYFEDNFENV